MANDPNILVTGATGFIGSVLTRQLVADGASVRILRRKSSSLDLLQDVIAEVDVAVGDVTHALSLYEAMEGIDEVYHVAAKVSFDRRDREVLRRVNVDGTANVVNAALEAGIDRLVHTSSMAAFGRPSESDMPIDETTSWRDADHRSAYARSKYRSELEVHRGIAEGLDAVIVNPALVFGVGRESSNTRRIVDLVRSGWLFAVPPGGTNVVDVQDVAAGLRKAMVHGETGRRYFLGGENLSWNAIAERLARVFQVPPPQYELPAPFVTGIAVCSEVLATLTRGQPFLSRASARTANRTYRYDNTRAKRELGCTFRSFEVTARRIARALSVEDGRSVERP